MIRVFPFLVFVSALVLTALKPSHAQVVSWDGGGDGTSWSDPANWNPDGVPGLSDDVEISLSPAGSYIIVLESATTIQNLSIASSKATLELQASLEVTGSLTQQSGSLKSGADVTVAGGYLLDNRSARLESAHDVTVQGLFTWRGGTVAGGGTLVAAGGAEIVGGRGSASWSKSLDGSRLQIPTGTTLAYIGTMPLRGGNGAVIEVESGAVFDVQNWGDLSVFSGSTTAPQLVNRGTLKKTGGDHLSTVAFDVVNSGLIEAANDVLIFTGGLTDEGGTYRALVGTLDFSLVPAASDYTFTAGSQITVSPGAAVNFGAQYSTEQTARYAILGTFDAEGTTSVRGDNHRPEVTIASTANLVNLGAEGLRVGGNRGALTVQTSDPLTVGDLTIAFEGALSLASDLTVTGNYIHTNATSILQGDVDVTVAGSLTWDGGTMTGSGTTLVNGGVNIYGSAGSASNVKRLDGRDLVFAAGEGVFDGQVFYGGNGATFAIEANASFDIAPLRSRSRSIMSVLAESNEPPVFINRGIIFTTQSGALLRTDWPMENAGSLDLGGADLVVEPRAGLVNTGTIQGSGSILGNVMNSEGIMSPGAVGQPGQITIDGTFSQGPGGTISVEIGGATAGTGYDQLSADAVELDGTLRLGLIDGFVPGSSVFDVVRWPASMRTGSFATIEGQDAEGTFLTIRYADEAVEVYDGSLPDPPPSPQVSVTLDSPPIQRRGRSVPMRAKLTNDGGASVVRVRTKKIQLSLSPFGSVCPTEDAYENLKCRMERFGVTPPPPEEEESYPYLAQVNFPGPIAGGDGAGGDGSTGSAAFSASGSLEFGGAEICEEDAIQASIEAGAPVTDEDLSGCAYAIAKLALNFVPGYDCFKLATGIGTSIGEGIHAGQFDLTGYLASNMVGALNCAGDAVPATKAIKIMLTLNGLASKAGGIQGVSDACSSAAGESTTSSSAASSTTCIASYDPNDKFGPPGVGSNRYVARSDTLPYVIFFENKAEATAAAQIVMVSDTVDFSVLDFETFSFGMIAWGDTSIAMPDDQTSVTKDIDLRPDLDLITRIEAEADSASGLVSWRFTSLDPATMELTNDPLAGFLPPNQNPPEGEGLVSYFVEPFDTLANETSFGHAARIVFDENPPIDTPAWSNAIDAAPPSSSVEELEAVQTSENFSVEWSGRDGESGIASYRVYVSVDGAAFQEWLSSTSQTSAAYAGSDGVSYEFYSVATDSIGNTETAPSEAQAVTTVDLSTVAAEEPELPTRFEFSEPYPNPFTDTANLSYALPKASLVRFVIYDALGREVRTLVGEVQPAGRHVVELHAGSLASGTYVCVMEADTFRASRLLVVVR